MSEPRKICVVTGSRAEYGLLYWLMREIAADPGLRLQVLVTGMHLSPEFGSTYRVIEADGFHIDRRVEMLLSSDSPIAMAKSLGLGTIGSADAFASLEPDAVVVLGDRFEILAAAQAAFLSGIAVAHISGGEVTEGAVDDAIRHAITKMARYHFVATESYRRRVIQLGEPPENVFNVGDPGLDNIVRLELLLREPFAAALGMNPARPFFLVTYHPVTSGTADPGAGVQSLLESLDTFTGYDLLITRPNADAGGREISRVLDEYAKSRTGRVHVVTSLGQLKYLSAMRHCEAVVGNSSSGIVEAPAMGKPVVNIGPRQSGRLKATCIIDCAATRAAITAALTRAVSVEFKAAAAQCDSLYGNSSASTQICTALRQLDLARNTAKRFHDLPG